MKCWSHTNDYIEPTLSGFILNADNIRQFPNWLNKMGLVTDSTVLLEDSQTSRASSSAQDFCSQPMFKKHIVNTKALNTVIYGIHTNKEVPILCV
jgi:hypothetical protein